ncbi:hypothetical protein D2T31_12080 [Sinirhodobacter populi]|uniref:Uncharacterized protein n=1 Tax=Paenirhodobacter populi TaxID=2306993 RepID=A0A443K7U4_9RHOB|nr:hypothetical protein [Sinirhodobacter populi]RWR28844.1 hypothetical protein D2T31_12080 [Sinirhodobacter populi]
MKRAEKIGEATINGKQVSFFTPPHDEPDFPWVDHYELLRAFVGRSDAKALVSKTRRFKDGQMVSVSAKNGAKIVSIIPHGIAQALIGALDNANGHGDEDGPAFNAYCRAAGEFCKDHWPQSLEYMLAAFKNNGGPIMRVHRPVEH